MGSYSCNEDNSCAIGKKKSGRKKIYIDVKRLKMELGIHNCAKYSMRQMMLGRKTD